MRFSIIIPVYNTERYLPQCLDSILSQSFTDFEVICVDDGSTDGSLAVLKEYEIADRRIKVFQRSHEGVSKTRNLALKNVSGDYILFVDSDDWILPDALNSFDEECRNNHPDILAFPSKRYLELGKKYVEELMYEEVSFERGADFYRYASGIRTRDAFGTICGKVYSLNILKKGSVCFSEDVSYHEDMLFVIDACVQAGRVKIIQKAFYVYRIREVGNIMSTFASRRYFDMANVANILGKRYLGDCRLPQETLCKTISSYYRNCLIWGGWPMYGELKKIIDWNYFGHASLVSWKAWIVYCGLRTVPFAVIPVLAYRHGRQISRLKKHDIGK